MKILMNEVQKNDLLLHLITRDEIMQIIFKEKQTLPKDVKFPTENIGLNTDIHKLIKISHRIAGKRELIIDIQIPLVETSAYEVMRIFITP